MANEVRLIDANALMDDVDKSKYDNPHTIARVRLNHHQEHDHFYKMIYDAPTVDALVLPCKVGESVWTVAYHKVYEAKVICIRPFVYKDFVEFRGNATITYVDPFYSDGRLLTQELFVVFGKDTFLTKAEAEAALAKMDGGNEDVNLR